MRGEYGPDRLFLNKFAELPPRARRILNDVFPRPFDAGTTSACAENTGKSIHDDLAFWNYLRVRGEY